MAKGTVAVFHWVARVAGSFALLLGLSNWIFALDIINIHMLLGLSVALSLLVLGGILLATKGLRPMGAAAIVYALFLPFFGLNQATWVVGDLHWLIKAAHLLVGVGAIGFAESMSTRFEQTTGTPSAPTPAVA